MSARGSWASEALSASGRGDSVRCRFGCQEKKRQSTTQGALLGTDHRGWRGRTYTSFLRGRATSLGGGRRCRVLDDGTIGDISVVFVKHFVAIRAILVSLHRELGLLIGGPHRVHHGLQEGVNTDTFRPLTPQKSHLVTHPGPVKCLCCPFEHVFLRQ